LQLLREGESPEFERLVYELHADEEWRSLPLQALLPGIGAGQTAILEMLSTRSVNCLGRIGVTSWPDLAERCPGSLSSLHGIGSASIAEILSVTVSEWATIFLSEDPPRVSLPAEPSQPGPREKQDLGRAFEELELKTPSFDTFKRRKLGRDSAPTLEQLGEEFGISRQAVSSREKRAQAAIEARTRERHCPIRSAADQVNALGPDLAPSALQALIAELDPDGVIFQAAPQREALLLWLSALGE
jgi:hypothetical protein